jgi:hypothetical protein
MTQPIWPSAAALPERWAYRSGRSTRMLISPSSLVACANSTSRIVRARLPNRKAVAWS